jgi:hypothetical protein
MRKSDDDRCWAGGCHHAPKSSLDQSQLARSGRFFNLGLTSSSQPNLQLSPYFEYGEISFDIGELMNDEELLGLQDVALYSRRRRNAIKAIFQLIFAVILASCALLFLQAGPSGTGSPYLQPKVDQPTWWWFAVGIGLPGLSIAAALGGITLFLSALTVNCYLKAGPIGLAARVPVRSWYGMYHTRELKLRWDEIQAFVHYVEIGGPLKAKTELRVLGDSGETLLISETFFDVSVNEMLTRIKSIRAMAGQ